MPSVADSVLLDARLSARGLGIGAFVERLTDGFASLGGSVPTLWAATPEGRFLAAGTLARSGLFDLSPRLDPRTRRYRVVHYASNFGSWHPGQRSVLTLFDLLCRRKLRARDWLYGTLLDRAIPRVGRLVAVSARTAGDVAKAFPALASRVEVIPPGLRPMAVGGSRQHVLAFGGLDPRKRADLAVEAYGHYRRSTRDPLPLVVLARAGLAGRVHESLVAIGARIETNASRAEVDALMAGAAALIHASAEEGFGLPVLEAAECGTPVVLEAGAGIASEVLGPHCYQVDGTDPAAWATMLERAIKAGPVPDALDLSDWTEVARRYKQIYEDLAA